MSGKPFAAIALVIDSYKVVINRGLRDGIKVGDKFLIYELTDDIIDPENGFSLGPLELSKGTGVAKNVQDRLTIIESDMIKEMPKSPLVKMVTVLDLPEEIKLPFDNPKVNDKAKPI